MCWRQYACRSLGEVVHDGAVDVRARRARPDRPERRLPRSEHVVEEPPHPVGRRAENERALELGLVAPDRSACLGDEDVADLELDVVRDRVRPRAPEPDLSAIAGFRAVAGAEQPARAVRGEHRERRLLLGAKACLGLGCADERVLLQQAVGVRAPASALPQKLHFGGALAHEHPLDLLGEDDTDAPVTSPSVGPR